MPGSVDTVGTLTNTLCLEYAQSTGFLHSISTAILPQGSKHKFTNTSQENLTRPRTDKYSRKKVHQK